MSEKRQFDEFLGGSEILPRDAHVMKLVSARAHEMASMDYSLENPKQNKLIFQKLPVHMRRRVMSHNAKRMPRKLRAGHLAQMAKSGAPSNSKRPSRKYRRRPRNLLSEYNRRQRNKFWLETHIWHAKRFKMIEKWGFKLADHSNDRCFRANYRAVINHCLIQDISYYTCLELRGPDEILKKKLKEHCNPNELTFGAKIYVNGEREGTLMFYKKNGYPNLPIGYVHFLWKSDDSDTKAIWIWVHPAFYSEVLQEITSNFNLELEEDKVNRDNESENSQDKNKSQDKEALSSSLRIFLTAKIPIYKNTDGCQLIILRNCLNRFRLTGPLALSILTDAFKLPNINSKTTSVDDENMLVDEEELLEKVSDDKKDLWQMDVDTNNKSKHSIDMWYTTFYQSKDNLETFKIQNDVYNGLKNLTSSDQLPPNMVLALTVLDPRFRLPNKRIKIMPTSEAGEKIAMPLASASKSPLWNSDIRNYVTKNCISASSISSIRSQNLVPGVANDEFYNEDIMHKIPILLVQKPGNNKHNNSIGFGSGIDIILPAGWAMQFWLAFILRCAKAGGLRESKSIAYENSNLNVPAINHPDTDAYKIEAKEEKTKMNEIYFKRPPNKRVNYIKFGISSPFFCEWNLLMKEWTNADDFYVLRDIEILSTLSTKILDLEMRRKIACKNNEENNMVTALNSIIEKKNCFVPVKIISERKGLPKDFAIICVPSQDDLKKYRENKKWSGPDESLKLDSNEAKRKVLRNDHQALLKRLRKQRVRAKKEMENANCNIPLEDSADIKHINKIHQIVKKKLNDCNKTIIEQQAQTMANLHLPECTSVKNSCDREVIGYVTQGGYSFSEAKGVGLGYVVLSSILNLIKNESNLVLARNTTTRKYSMCKLEILN